MKPKIGMNKIDANFWIFLIFRFVFLVERGTKSPKIMAQFHTPLYLLKGENQIVPLFQKQLKWDNKTKQKAV